MPISTNLNTAPYYDDFDEDDNFHRVLFRPGFSIQARELTTLQSILQAQVEKHGRHMFREGTVVIPGQASYSDKVETVNNTDRNSVDIEEELEKKLSELLGNKAS